VLKCMLNLGQQSTPPKVVRVPRFPHLAERQCPHGFPGGQPVGEADRRRRALVPRIG
jgi:hypothetical protein